jgi:hypothetical protein
MDLMGTSLDMLIVAAIIAATQVVKAMDETGKFKRFYPIIVLFLGAAAAVIKTAPFTWQGLGYNLMVYICLPSYIYKFGKTTILGK